AHGEAIVNYLARKEAATHSGRRRKGEARKLDYALLGWAVSANLGREWAARITPSLTAAVRAPEIARSGVLFSLQMHLSLGANTSLLGRSYSGGGAGSIFTFSLTLGDFIVPQLVGPPGYFIGNMVYSQQGAIGNMPMAAAFTLVPIVLIALYLAFVKRLGAFDAL
ncbi:hypothetical protein AAIG93_33715, partial [Pseudomonas aeruginosa]